MVEKQISGGFLSKRGVLFSEYSCQISKLAIARSPNLYIVFFLFDLRACFVVALLEHVAQSALLDKTSILTGMFFRR